MRCAPPRPFFWGAHRYPPGYQCENATTTPAPTNASALPPPFPIFSPQETVWQEFSPLAARVGAVNLGQGFPDWPTPDFVKGAMKKAQDDNANQYCRSAGHVPLVQALAKRYAAHLGRPINWETEVCVGVGASETLFAAMQALVEPGDEVILLTPAFDIYTPQVQMAGGECVYVPLRLAAGGGDGGGGGAPGAWRLDMAELRAAFSPRTRVLLLNTPQNPTGKVFSPAELAEIAAILADFPAVVAVCDEVYEHMVYEGARPFPRLAALPGMWERCVTISSSGKTFSCTGWKIGWAVGPPLLIGGLIVTNQWVQFSTSTPSQEAIAGALDAADAPHGGFPSYYAWLLAQYERKRDILMAGLAAAGLRPVRPEGGFFIIADTSNVAFPERFMALSTKAAPVMRRDWAFCRFLCEELKVGSIPPSAFYDEKDKHLAANMVRFAFCKADESLVEASKRLLQLREYAIDKSLLPPL